MSIWRARRAAAVIATLAIGGCVGATAGSKTERAPAPAAGTAPVAPASRLGHTEADVAFMSGMILHHAQAVLMAGWAPSHGASPGVQRLCERIVVGQQDEIELWRAGSETGVRRLRHPPYTRGRA